MSTTRTEYTYRHNSVSDMLAPFKVSMDFVFNNESHCRHFMHLCRDADEYVVVAGAWSDGVFTGTAVVPAL